ncbi:MAG: response regulator transcription factor [Alphaproteobacteria bacterium]|nr:response regulator transcription factor [Alphaproteobacteria bacterium]
MSNPTAIVAEDEDPQRKELVRMLAELWPELEIVAQCEFGAGALEAMRRLRPSVAFLDIQMPQISGIEVARAAAGRTSIVFVTAFDEFAVQAFEDGAIDYLLKPVRQDRLRKTIERTRLHLDNPKDISAVLLALEKRLLEASSPRLRWITAGEGASIRLVPIEEVVFFQAQDKYTRVVTARGEAHIRRSLKDILPELDPDIFWQVHRSAIVRVTAVQQVRRDEDGGHVISIAGRAETLPVASSYVHKFRGM